MQYPSDELYLKAKVLPIKGIFDWQTCVFIKEILSGKCFHNIEFRTADHEYNTRNSGMLCLNPSRLNICPSICEIPNLIVSLLRMN